MIEINNVFQVGPLCVEGIHHLYNPNLSISEIEKISQFSSKNWQIIVRIILLESLKILLRSLKSTRISWKLFSKRHRWWYKILNAIGKLDNYANFVEATPLYMKELPLDYMYSGDKIIFSKASHKKFHYKRAWSENILVLQNIKLLFAKESKYVFLRWKALYDSSQRPKGFCKTEGVDQWESLIPFHLHLFKIFVRII